MLPGKAPEREDYPKTRYADDVIEDLISKMNLNGADMILWDFLNEK